jgi:hypothetical protein
MVAYKFTTGRSWSLLIKKLGDVYAEHPILLEEPQRIANMDEKPLSASSEKIANGKEKVVYDKYVPFVPGMVIHFLTSDVPRVTFVPTVLGDGTKLKSAYILKVGSELRQRVSK